MNPIRVYTERAFSVMPPFYRASERTDRSEAIDTIIRTRALSLPSLEWKELLAIMDDFDVSS